MLIFKRMQCGPSEGSERKGWAAAELPMCHGTDPEDRVNLETSQTPFLFFTSSQQQLQAPLTQQRALLSRGGSWGNQTAWDSEVILQPMSQTAELSLMAATPPTRPM